MASLLLLEGQPGSQAGSAEAGQCSPLYKYMYVCWAFPLGGYWATSCFYTYLMELSTKVNSNLAFLILMIGINQIFTQSCYFCIIINVNKTFTRNSKLQTTLYNLWHPHVIETSSISYGIKYTSVTEFRLDRQIYTATFITDNDEYFSKHFDLSFQSNLHI